LVQEAEISGAGQLILIDGKRIEGRLRDGWQNCETKPKRDSHRMSPPKSYSKGCNLEVGGFHPFICTQHNRAGHGGTAAMGMLSRKEVQT
jgi:hypothetical protein